MYGQIAQIAHHFGWTFDYIVYNIDWRVVSRMMLDFPQYQYNKKEDKKKIDYKETSKINKTPMTAESWQDWADKLNK